MAKYKRLNDDAIVAACEVNIEGGVAYWETKLQKERLQVLRYFNGELPAPFHNGNSKYVSMDVYDAVESAKAALLETFSSGYNIVSFAPQGPEDVLPAKIASDYTDYVVFRQNDGYKIFSDVITDGLLARVGCAKVFWEEIEEEIEEEFRNAPPEELDALLGDPNVELGEHEVDPIDGTISGTILRKVDRSQVRIVPVAPEELVVSPRTQSDSEALFIAHKVRKTASDLIKAGYPKSIIEDIPTDEDIVAEQEAARRQGDLSADRLAVRREYQDQVRPIWVHECYIRLDVEGNGRADLWKIVIAGKKVLDKQKVDRHPFVFFVPLPIPHAFYGSNFANKVVPIQNARTVLMRGILDHTVITNNPRTIVVKGALVNPREMLENRIGGVVNVTRPDGIQPYPQANLNPYVFQTINLLDQDKEENTGISKLSQGLNKDAISNQNSEGLVENLVGLSQQRQKIIARNFANGFLTKLYLEVYRLVIENEKRPKIVEIAGQWTPVNVESWIERKDCTVSLELGYGEQKKRAQKYMMIHQMLSQDPMMSSLYPLQQRYNTFKAAMDAAQIKNVSDFMISPQDPSYQPPQPDPMQQAKVAELQARADVQQRQIALQEMQEKFRQMMTQMEMELTKSKHMIDLMVEQRDLERREFEAKSRASTAQQELAIIKANQDKVSDIKQTDVVSPNS